MATGQKHKTPKHLDRDFKRAEIPQWQYYWKMFHMPMKRFWQLYWALLGSGDPDPVRTIQGSFSDQEPAEK